MNRRGRIAALALTLAALTAGCGGSAAPGAVVGRVDVPEVTATVPPAVPPAVDPGPAPTPAPAVMARSAPLRVAVPSIGVDSELMALGLAADGTMEVPPGAFPAGWFTGAPTPGELGPAVIVGHIDWVTGPGVFERLADVAVGDEIRVERSDGSTAVFRTTLTARYVKDAFPTDLVYGNLDHAGLRLISCGGAFNRATGHYEDNVVVYAELVPAATT